MKKENHNSSEDIKIIKGDYEVFEVGEELVFSDKRDKIKEYARKQGLEHITYKMSFDNKKGAESLAKEIK